MYICISRCHAVAPLGTSKYLIARKMDLNFREKSRFFQRNFFYLCELNRFEAL